MTSEPLKRDVELEAPALEPEVSQALPRHQTAGEVVSRGAEFVIRLLTP